MIQRDLYFRRRSRRKVFKVFWFFCSLAIFAGLGYFLAFSKYFLVKGVQVQTDPPAGEAGDSDKQQIAEFVWQELKNRKLGIIPENNILFLNRDGLISILLEKNAFYKSFKFDYRFEDQSLTISGQTRNGVAQVCKNNICFTIDEDGIAFVPIESSLVFGHRPSNTLLFTLDNSYDKDIVLGEQTLPKELIVFAAEFKKLADENVGVERAVIEKEYLEAHFVKFVTNQNWYILTVFDFDPGNVFENLKLVMEKELKGKQGGLEYIDLRYKDKAYYKFTP